MSNNVNSNYCRPYPNNVKVVRLRYNLSYFEKFLSLSQIISSEFWKELITINDVLKMPFSFGIIKTLLCSLYNSKRLMKSYRKVFKINENDIMYSYWLNDVALSLAIIKNKLDLNIKCVSRMHRWDIYFNENKYSYLPLRNFLFDKLDCIYSISVDGKRYVSQSLKLDNSKIKISQLGIPQQKNNLIENNYNRFLVVSCSNVIDVKRVILIAKSLKATKLNNFIWTHFGDGPKLDELISYCDENFLKTVKISFPGRLSNKKILDFYSKNTPSLFINLSSSEGVPVSIMEAMSFGIPVIATNVGGTSEIVNNKNGYLLEANPSKFDVALKIQKFYNLEIEEKTQKRKAAFNTWNSKYNAEKNYSQFVEEILSL